MFFEKVYQTVKKIPRGKVATYGMIARLIGCPGKARQVGWALHANKQYIVVPCHRVVNRFGELAPGFVFGGEEEQKRLLELEGVKVENNKVDLNKYLWKPL
jgi:methylated-DNA-protein-cysteine methyltransferase-like protein